MPGASTGRRSPAIRWNNAPLKSPLEAIRGKTRLPIRRDGGNMAEIERSPSPDRAPIPSARW